MNAKTGFFVSSLKQRLKNTAFRSLRGLDLAVRVKARLRHLPPDQLRRFLFLQYELALGTAVNSTPLFEAIKETVPNACISVACSGVTYGVLRHNPYIDLVIETPHAITETLAAARVIREALKDNSVEIDCVATSSWNQRSKLAVLAFLVGPYLRFGHTLANGFYHKQVLYEDGISVIDNNLNFLKLLGRKPVRTNPRLFFSASEKTSAENLLVEHEVDRRKPLVIFVTQTSGTQPSRWYNDRFSSTADYVVTKYNANVVFVGTGKESAGIEEIRSGMREKSISVAGRTDIPTLAALMAMSDLVVAVDTGTMHVARAVRAPIVIIAPAWQPDYEWLPLGDNLFNILRRNDIGCRHCRKFQCETRECMDEITTSNVFSAIDGTWRNFPPSPEARASRILKSFRGPAMDPDTPSDSVLNFAGHCHTGTM